MTWIHYGLTWSAGALFGVGLCRSWPYFATGFRQFRLFLASAEDMADRVIASEDAGQGERVGSTCPMLADPVYAALTNQIERRRKAHGKVKTLITQRSERVKELLGQMTGEAAA